MAETLSALMIVIATIALVRTVAVRTGLADKVRGAERLRVEENCTLSNRQRICIVEADGRRLLIGVSDGGISLLDRLSDRVGVEENVSEEPALAEITHLKRPLRWLRLLASAILVGGLANLLTPMGAYAQAVDPASISLGLGGLTAPDEISSALEIVILLTIVSVAPSILLMATCFTRVVIVLSFLRQAIGVQQLPPSQVLVGLSFFITLFVMAPVGEDIRINAYEPYVAQEIDAKTAADRAITPVREFMMAHTREADMGLFLELSGQGMVADLADVPSTSLLPAFMLSELRTAFEIGFMIYLPFLVIDLIVASMLISMGMIVLPPIVISMPFKLMLFVLMDGWNRIVGSLVDGLI